MNKITCIITGFILGVYTTQNYNIPNINKFIRCISQLEKSVRLSNEDNNKNNNNEYTFIENIKKKWRDN